jgi:hypothetical protein
LVLTKFPLKLIQVIVSCTFRDYNNRTRSCVERSKKVPLVKIFKEDCSKVIDDDCVMESQVKLEVCNRNPSEPITPRAASDDEDDKENGSRIKTSRITRSFEELGKMGVIQPNECVTLLEEQQLINATKPVDAKGAHKYPLEIFFEGNMPQLGAKTSYCHAAIHAKNLMKLYPDEVKDDPTFYASDPAPVPNELEHGDGSIKTSVSDANIINYIISFIVTHI